MSRHSPSELGRECASWIVRARRTGAVLPCYRYEVSVENSSEPCFVEIAPFKPMPKPHSVIHAKDKVQSFEAVPQVGSVKGPGAPSAMHLSVRRSHQASTW